MSDIEIIEATRKSAKNTEFRYTTALKNTEPKITINF